MEMELGLLAKRKLFSLIKNGVWSPCSRAQAARVLSWEGVASLGSGRAAPAPELSARSASLMEPAASAILPEGRWFEES